MVPPLRRRTRPRLAVSSARWTCLGRWVPAPPTSSFPT